MTHEFSGALNQRIMLQLPVDSADGGGGQQRNWQNAGELWAHIMPQTQDERRYAGHVATRSRYHILVRRDGDIPLAARFLWGARKLAILVVEDDPADPDRLRIIAEQERELS
jgi:SPP1 family predicted phage head-tail adaptor